jgi:hypothetical protein
VPNTSAEEFDDYYRSSLRVYAIYAAIAIGCAVGAVFASGWLRVVLIVVAVFFAVITVWSVFFMGLMKSVSDAAKGRHR